jgi:hypothetical protein
VPDDTPAAARRSVESALELQEPESEQEQSESEQLRLQLLNVSARLDELEPELEPHRAPGLSLGFEARIDQIRRSVGCS